MFYKYSKKLLIVKDLANIWALREIILYSETYPHIHHGIDRRQKPRGDRSEAVATKGCWV